MKDQTKTTRAGEFNGPLQRTSLSQHCTFRTGVPWKYDCCTPPNRNCFLILTPLGDKKISLKNSEPTTGILHSFMIQIHTAYLKIPQAQNLKTAQADSSHRHLAEANVISGKIYLRSAPQGTHTSKIFREHEQSQQIKKTETNNTP